MNREEAIIQLDYLKDFKTPDQVKALDMAIKALEQEPSGDLISRQAVLDELSFYLNDTTMIEEDIKKLPSVNPQEPKAEQFAEWVATEIFDENWEYNKDAFDELACRKLAKLGIVRENGDEWELVEQKESEDKE